VRDCWLRILNVPIFQVSKQKTKTLVPRGTSTPRGTCTDVLYWVPTKCSACEGHRSWEMKQPRLRSTGAEYGILAEDQSRHRLSRLFVHPGSSVAGYVVLWHPVPGTYCTHWTRRKLHAAIKTFVFANRPCKRAWSTRLAIAHNPRLKIGAKLNFRESYELRNSIFRGSYFHRYTTFPHTIHKQF
jgi:hypothetical protein